MIQSLPIPPIFFFFFTFFLIIYIISYSIILKNWNPKYRPEAASCCISLCHGTPAAILAIYSILSNTHTTLISPNTHLQNLVFEFSTAYFIMDLIHYLVFYPYDYMFIGHHLATLFVFLTARYLVSHGAFCILVLLILAELSSLLQNVWTLTSARRNDSEFAENVYRLLSVPFYLLYSVLRGFLGPYFVYKMVCFYVGGGAQGLIPTWVWFSWVCVVVAAILVSNLWIWNRWVEYFRERKCGLEKKFE